jgi:type 1 glutamine amidotransferase
MLLLAPVLLFLARPTVAAERSATIRALVVTGGHDFEKQPFADLFAGHDGIEVAFAQHPQAGEMFAADKADAYDVLVFYDMPAKLPSEQLERLTRLLDRGKGVVGLHHTLASVPNRTEYHHMLGGKFLFQSAVINGVKHRNSTFHHGQVIPVRIADTASPITAGLKEFTIHDETYNHFLVDAHVHPLLTTDHPMSGKVLAWTHRAGNSPVVYIQLGHDAQAYRHPSYRRLVANAIRWAGSPQAIAQVTDADGFRPIFNGVDLTGWEGDTSHWLVEGGMVVGKSPGIKHNDFLNTTRTYGDFELRLDFHMLDGKGNSGIQFRSRKIPQHVSGYQADIGENYWGCLYDEARRNKVLVPADDALKKVLKKDGWNRYVIRVAGDHVVLKINGVTTVDYREPDAEIAREGIISLQIHSGPPMEIRFKDIRIKELNSDK